MVVLQLCFLALALLPLLIWHFSIRRSCRGYSSWPIVGILPSLFFNLGRIHDWLTEYVDLNGGTARLYGPWKSRILTTDPANLEYILKTRFDNFRKADSFKDAFSDFMGDSHLIQDGERHAQLSKSMAMAFTFAGFRDTAAAAIRATVHQKLLPLLRQTCEKGTVIDFQDVFLRLAFDNVCVVGLGMDPASLSSELPRVPFLETFKEAIEASMFRMIMPAFCWKTMRCFNLGSERRLRRARKFVHSYIDDLRTRWDVGDRSNSDRRRSYIVSALVHLERESGRHCSDKTMQRFFFDLFLAGNDTITAGLTWFFWLVTQHPHVEAKIFAELVHIFKQNPDADSGEKYDSFSFSFDELKQMHFLHATLTESLRLYPPIPIEVTEAAEDDVLPDGVRVEKGSEVFYSIYACGRMEKVWGEDCREFKPERWLRDGRFVRESEFKFVVFNGGPRRCHGREFAYWQMKWVAASIILRYRVSLLDGHSVLPKFTLSLAMKDGLLVTIHPRVEEGQERLETLSQIHTHGRF